MQQSTLHLPNPQDWMSVKQAVAALRINRGTIYVMIEDGRLADYRIGTHRVFWRPQIEEMAAALKAAWPARSGAR